MPLGNKFPQHGAAAGSPRRGAWMLYALVACGTVLRGGGAIGQSPELIPATEARPTAPANDPVHRPSAAELPLVSKAPEASPSVSPSHESTRVNLAEALDRVGDVTFRNTTIEAALFTIGETWKVNIIAGKDVTGAVNGVFKQAPLREILDAVLLANGYSYRIVGDSLVVQAAGDVGSANPLFRSTTVPILNGDLAEIVEGAKLLVSTTGQIKALPSAKSVLIVDYADRVESIAAFVSRMDEAAASAAGGSATTPAHQLEVAYFHTHFIPVASAQQTLLTVLSPLGRLGLMPRENRLLVVDYPANLEMVRKVLERIDRPRPQVRITALIYDLSLDDAEQLGLNWGNGSNPGGLASYDRGANGDTRQSLQFSAATTTVAPGQPGTISVRSLTRNFDLVTVMNLLQNAKDARLLADPNVTVVDNELAEWKSVSEIPYQQITQSELGGQIGTTAFKEAGITLRVQPSIAGDGTIEMMVEPEFSRLAGFTPGESQPIIDTRKATTRIRVANRQTVVIGGLRQRSDTGEFNGIPWLKDVKYVGPLFRSRDTTVRESELIVFIMPEIVAYDDQPPPRQFEAQNTIHCRLDAIPPAEGCRDGCGPDGCTGPTIWTLPPVDETPASPLNAQAPADEAVPAPPADSPPANPSTGALRPGFDARFRASQRRPTAPAKQAEQPSTKSAWRRMIGS